MGKALPVVISNTFGLSTSAGSSWSALFWTSRWRSLSRLSKVAASISWNRTRMLETFSRLVLATKRMSETLRTASSSGSVTRRSTSSAAAPGKIVVTWIQLKLISGSCWRGSCR